MLAFYTSNASFLCYQIIAYVMLAIQAFNELCGNQRTLRSCLTPILLYRSHSSI